ncbi:MAG: hypothetical protein GC149_16165 [Gammaproteobacteria bacterium]|nr:hypothetical protein [Gammaproteobacteria bacterium]
MKRGIYLRCCVGLWLLILAGMAGADERSDIGLGEREGLSLTLGLEYASGDYGTSSTTDLWQVPFGVDYVKGNVSAGIYSSLLSAKSSGAIIVSSSMTHMTKLTTSSTAGSKASGIGDINMYATYQLPQAAGSEIAYHVTGRIKLGTADEKKGLGTGENDYALEGGLVMPFEKVYLFGSVGYQVNGDSATVNYDDVLYANAGATYPMGKGRSLGAMLEVAQAATPGFDAPAQATVFYNQELDKRKDLFFYLSVGLSNGSPDSAVGALLTIWL